MRAVTVGDPRAEKARLRAVLRRHRAGRPAAEREAAGVGLATLAAGLVVPAGAAVAAYAAVGDEPPTAGLRAALRARGVRVVLPVLAGPDLAWAVDDGRLAAGPHGLLEPTGPRWASLGAAGVGLVLAPALAVDRAGHRLGRGAGFYDRALAGLDPAVPVLAVVYADEVLDAVPAEPHDVAVSGALTPAARLDWRSQVATDRGTGTTPPTA